MQFAGKQRCKGVGAADSRIDPEGAVRAQRRRGSNSAWIRALASRLRGYFFFIRPLPSSSQSRLTSSFTASVMRKSVWGVVPFS